MRERFRNQLSRAGYSITVPRSAVFEVLSDQAYSMLELQAKLQGSLDRASLYRTLLLFEQLQIIQSIGQIGRAHV